MLRNALGGVYAEEAGGVAVNKVVAVDALEVEDDDEPFVSIGGGGGRGLIAMSTRKDGRRGRVVVDINRSVKLSERPSFYLLLLFSRSQS